MNVFFGKLARWVSDAVGSPYAFVIALAAVVVWAASGPLFGFSSTWQLVINTGTTIVTFLMVFVIQNAQNRDQLALQIKLDELLRAVGEARTGFVSIEQLDGKTLGQLNERFQQMHEDHREEMATAMTEVVQGSGAESDGGPVPAPADGAPDLTA